MSQKIHHNIKFKFFNKTSPGTNGIYGLDRFEDINKIQMIQNNYFTIKNTLEAKHLLILKHVHGNTVMDADGIQDFSIEPQADGAVTSQKGIILSVQSADCVPVLLASDNGDIIGAAHCGWRSARSDVLMNVTKLMQNKGAQKITAIIGPAIHQDSYEVDQLFYDEIVSSASQASMLFKQSLTIGKWLFNLPGFVKLKLENLGISEIIDACENTYANPSKYYSYRYDLHNGIVGNQTNVLSTIMIV